MEVFMACGVPERSPLFAALALMDLAGSTAIRVRLVAVCTVVTEAGVGRAVLPADWANAAVAILAVRVAKSAVLLVICGAGGERLAGCATVGLLPARLGNFVVEEAMERRSVVIPFGVREWLIRALNVVSDTLIVFVVWVSTS